MSFWCSKLWIEVWLGEFYQNQIIPAHIGCSRSISKSHFFECYQCPAFDSFLLHNKHLLSRSIRHLKLLSFLYRMMYSSVFDCSSFIFFCVQKCSWLKFLQEGESGLLDFRSTAAQRSPLFPCLQWSQSTYLNSLCCMRTLTFRWTLTILQSSKTELLPTKIW